MNTLTNIPEIHTGTPRNATSATITLDKDASDRSGAYTGFALRIIEGAGLGEQQTIKAYDGRSKIATLHGTWTAVPDTTSVYVIAGPIFTEQRKFKTSIDVSIDPDLKTEFESLKETHELTFSDALEIGMKEVIHKVRSPEEIRRRINRKQDEIFYLYSQLDRAIDARTHPQDDTDFRWDKDGKI